MLLNPPLKTLAIPLVALCFNKFVHSLPEVEVRWSWLEMASQTECCGVEHIRLLSYAVYLPTLGCLPPSHLLLVSDSLSRYDPVIGSHFGALYLH